MPAKWRISAAFILSLAAVTFGDEPRPTVRPTSLSTAVTADRSSSTAELVRQVAEQLNAANRLEESLPGNGPQTTSRNRSAEDANELSLQIAEVQKQLDRLRELTGRPSRIEFRFRVLEVPAKLAAELASLGIDPLTGSSLARSLCKDTAELNKRIREAEGVKTSCDTSIVAAANRPATFQAGGEFPILIPAKGNDSEIVWRDFGNRCELVASHLDANRLRVEFQAESSQRSLDDAVVIAGTTVPSLMVRRVNMQVELNLGETIIIALQAPNPKVRANAASQPGEPPVTLFTLTPSSVEPR